MGLIMKKISNFWAKYSLLDPKQHAYLRGRGTQTATTKCDSFQQKLKKEFPEKRVLTCTGSSDDNTKKDFHDVPNIWNKCDILIFSPTCEAGVNFDIDHFDRMFGILSNKSTTPRGFLRMLARIRKVKNNEIVLLK
jgi:hypothetical protein